MSARVIHLNGPPGVGKSTLARRYADEHPGTLCLDIDALRTFVGGWREDFVGAGALVREPALALMLAWLEGGHDVVLPQLLADPGERSRFRAAALGVGAGFVTVMLWAELDEAVARFRARPVLEPWQAVVAELTDESALGGYHRLLADQVAADPEVLVVGSGNGRIGEAYAELLRVLGDRGR